MSTSSDRVSARTITSLSLFQKSGCVWRAKEKKNTQQNTACKQTNYKVNILYIVNGLVGLQASWTQHESHICEHCDRALCFNLFVHTHTDKHNEYLSCELLLMSGLSRAHSILINKCVFFILYKTLGKCRLQLKRKTLHAVWCGYFNIKSGFGLWILVSLVMLRCNVWCCRIVPSITLSFETQRQAQISPKAEAFVIVWFQPILVFK